MKEQSGHGASFVATVVQGEYTAQFRRRELLKQYGGECYIRWLGVRDQYRLEHWRGIKQ